MKQKREVFAKEYSHIVITAFLLLMLVVFPFYAPEGYVEIGNYKFYFFRTVSVVVFSLLVPVVPFFVWDSYKKGGRVRLSATDAGALLYGTGVFFSFLFSQWQEEAVWGAEGWYMGVFSQFAFVAIYFAVSRFAERVEKWYELLLAVSAVVFLLGLLNRFSVYPLQMNGVNPGFISTLGNINWFCSYWMVIFPVGMVLYWNGGETVRYKKIALIFYLTVGFMTGIVQGSSSGFLALAAVFVVLFLLSFREEKKLLRWLELVLLFVLSMLGLSVWQSLCPGALNYENPVAQWLTTYAVGVIWLAVAVTCYAVVHFLVHYKKWEISRFQNLRRGGMVVLVAAIVLLGLLFLIANGFPEKVTGTFGERLVVDEQWGNGRGATWYAGVEAFRTMSPLEKMVGVGADCFHKYVYGNWDIATMLYRTFGDAILTNAHNEWLTILVNTGLFGLVSYVVFLGTAVGRQLKAGKNCPLLLVSGICVIAYTAHNMVSFQQVIGTPILFILIGMGEKIMNSNLTDEKNVV